MSSANALDTEQSLAGLRILVVEDEMMVAMMIEDLLKGLGCDVIKAGRVKKALHIVAAGGIDAAILDINIAGEAVYPVVHELQKHGIPFIFSSGYDAVGLPPDYRDSPTLSKPFRREDLAPMLLKAIQDRH